MEKIKLFCVNKWPLVEEYLISGIVSFVAGFCIALIPQLQNLDTNKIEAASIWALILVCIRAGFKMLIEQFLVPQIKRLVEYLNKQKVS